VLLAAGGAWTVRSPHRPGLPEYLSLPKPVESEAPRADRPEPRGTIAFVRDGDIWLAPRRCPARLLVRAGRSPCWSLDRRRVAFARDGDVWVAAADGSGERRLTAFLDYGCEEISISWDPVADAVTFSRGYEYHLMPPAYAPRSLEPAVVVGTAVFDVPVTAGADRRPPLRFGITERDGGFQCSDQDAPAWSPSGRYLAFVRNGDIWVARRSGPRFERDPVPSAGYHHWSAWQWEVSRLLATARFDVPTHRASACTVVPTRLSWAPDERSLVYGCRRQGGTGVEEIRLLRLLPSRDTPIGLVAGTDTTLARDGVDPCFAPDGRSVAYQTYAGYTGYGGIVSLSLDGRSRRRLIRRGEQPAW
jgi:hypothetical protein